LEVPIDVVASVQVISNPYDPQYGKLTGAVSSVETKTSNYEKPHFSIQNVLPRARVRDGSVLGIGGATPRMTFTGPIVKDRVAFTQSLEYRYIRTPVNSLPATERDTKLESVNSYSQVDLSLTPSQTATVSLSIYPQKLQYMGLNTFTPQNSTPDYHQRGYQFYTQHRYISKNGGMLTSQVAYKVFDADITSHSGDPYRLLVDTTEGSFFNQQKRRANRFDVEEKYQFPARQFLGTHLLKVGLDYSHSNYDGRQEFRPVEIESAAGTAIEQITFGAPNSASVQQHETSWYATDQWTPTGRLTLDLGLRFDSDTITSSAHAAPRAGFQLALTRDGKTMLKGGGGIFYDRVPLMIAAFPSLPSRTVAFLDASGLVTGSTLYVNRIMNGLQNPRSTAWNLGLSREIVHGLIVQVGYESRITSHDFIVSPLAGTAASLDVSNRGGQSYREFQVVGRYQFRAQTLNASYVRSRAYGNLNDFFQYFGNVTKPVVQADDKGRLAFDAPNRVLLWGEFKAPWRVIVTPVYDIHTGFPYSVQNEYREYIGPRNTNRYPQFASCDVQALRPFSLKAGDKHIRGRVGLAIFNVFNHDNPREVQNIAASPRYGQFFNDAWREYRGKFIFEF
jgi:TonB dependent receptor